MEHGVLDVQAPGETGFVRQLLSIEEGNLFSLPTDSEAERGTDEEGSEKDVKLGKEFLFSLKHVRSVRELRPGGRVLVVETQGDKWLLRTLGSGRRAANDAKEWIGVLSSYSYSSAEKSAAQQNVWDFYMLHNKDKGSKRIARWLRAELQSLGLSCKIDVGQIGNKSSCTKGVKGSSCLCIPLYAGSSFSKDCVALIRICMKIAHQMEKKIFLLLVDDDNGAQDKVASYFQKCLPLDDFLEQCNIEFLRVPEPEFGNYNESVACFNNLLRHAGFVEKRRPVFRRCRVPVLDERTHGEGIREKTVEKLIEVVTDSNTILFGGGFIGKTTVATEAVNSDDVRRSYPGGVLWLDCSWCDPYKRDTFFGPDYRIVHDITLDLLQIPLTTVEQNGKTSKKGNNPRIGKQTEKSCLKEVENALIVLDNCNSAEAVEEVMRSFGIEDDDDRGIKIFVISQTENKTLDNSWDMLGARLIRMRDAIDQDDGLALLTACSSSTFSESIIEDVQNKFSLLRLACCVSNLGEIGKGEDVWRNVLVAITNEISEDALSCVKALSHCIALDGLFSPTDLEVLTGCENGLIVIKEMEKVALVSRVHHFWLPTEGGDSILAFRIPRPVHTALQDLFMSSKKATISLIQRNISHYTPTQEVEPQQNTKGSLGGIMHWPSSVYVRTNLIDFCSASEMTSELLELLFSWDFIESIVLSWMFNQRMTWTAKKLTDVYLDAEALFQGVDLVRVQNVRKCFQVFERLMKNRTKHSIFQDTRDIAEFLWNSLSQTQHSITQTSLEAKGGNNRAQVYVQFIQELDKVRKGSENQGRLYSFVPTGRPATALPSVCRKLSDRSLRTTTFLSEDLFATCVTQQNNIEIRDSSKVIRNSSGILECEPVDKIHFLDRTVCCVERHGDILGVLFTQQVALYSIPNLLGREKNTIPTFTGVFSKPQFTAAERNTIRFNKTWIAATVKNKNVVLCWDIANRENHVLQLGNVSVNCTVLIENLLCVGTAEGSLLCWNLSQQGCEQVQSIEGAHKNGSLECLCATVQHHETAIDTIQYICSGGRDDMVNVFKVHPINGKLSLVHQLLNDAHITSLNIWNMARRNATEQSTILSATCVDSKIRLWNVESGKLCDVVSLDAFGLTTSEEHKKHNKQKDSVLYHKRNHKTCCAVVCNERWIKFATLLQTQNKKERHMFEISNYDCNRLWEPRKELLADEPSPVLFVTTRQDPSGDVHILTAAADHTVTVWHIPHNADKTQQSSAPKVACVLRGHTKKITGLAVSPANEYILEPVVVSTGRDKLRCWDLYTGKHLKAIDATTNQERSTPPPSEEQEEEEEVPNLDAVNELVEDQRTLEGFGSLVLSAVRTSKGHLIDSNFVSTKDTRDTVQMLIITVANREMVLRAYAYPSYNVIFQISLVQSGDFAITRSTELACVRSRKSLVVWVAVPGELLVWNLKAPQTLTAVNPTDEHGPFGMDRVLTLQSSVLGRKKPKPVMIVSVRKPIRSVLLLTASGGDLLKRLDNDDDIVKVTGLSNTLDWMIAAKSTLYSLSMWDTREYKRIATLPSAWTYTHHKRKAKVSALGVVPTKDPKEQLVIVGLDHPGPLLFGFRAASN